MRLRHGVLVLLASCKPPSALTPLPTRESTPVPAASSETGGVTHHRGNATLHCFDAAPPNGIYDVDPSCTLPECRESGRLRIAVIGGCVGLARGDSPPKSHGVEVSVIDRGVEAGEHERALLVDWPTYIGGCNKGRAASVTLAKDGVHVDVGGYICMPTATQGSTSVDLVRNESLGTDVARLLADSRREVVAAALERAAADGVTPCEAWAELLGPERSETDPQLAARAIELAHDSCLAPALTTMLTGASPWLAGGAAGALERLLAPDDRAELLVKTVRDGGAPDDALSLLALQLASAAARDATAGLMAIAAAPPRPKAVEQALTALYLIDRERFAATFWSIYDEADCSAREQLANDEHTFAVVIGSDDARIIEVANDTLVDPKCPRAAARMAQWFGARFDHEEHSSERAFATVRKAAERSRPIRVALREGMACGGSSCTEVGTCHFGDPAHVSVERDRLLALLGLPMCPQQ